MHEYIDKFFEKLLKVTILLYQIPDSSQISSKNRGTIP